MVLTILTSIAYPPAYCKFSRVLNILMGTANMPCGPDDIPQGYYWYALQVLTILFNDTDYPHE